MTTDNSIPFRTSTFQYDSQGNLLREERKTEGNRRESIYSYDGFNRQKKIVNFESRVQVNRYDGEGLRHEMEENRKLVKFLYNDHEAVVEEKEDRKTIRYIRGYDLVASDSESARTYYHYASDEQGSITHVLGEGEDGSYGLRNYYEYGAFGDFREKEEETENRFGYNGEIFDPIGGQYYLRARYYNPVIGRFTQEDTYYGDELNLYAYCANLPVGYEDPSGHVAHAICVSKYNEYKKKLENGEKLSRQEKAEMRRYERAKNDPLYQLERQTGKSSAQLYNEMTQKGYFRGKDGRWFDNETRKCVSYEELGIEGRKKKRTNVQRKRWKEYTGQDPKGEIHHGLPEDLSAWFKSKGLDVNSGEFYYDLPLDMHRYKDGKGLHTNNSPLGKDWNQIWEDYKRQNNGTTKEQILAKLAKMERDANIGQKKVKRG